VSPELQLQQAYREWRRLAEAEGAAIRSGHWLLVADCQKAIRELQPLISRLSDASRKAWAREGSTPEPGRREISDLMAEVFESESRNSTLLRSLREFARAQNEKLDRACRQLRQIHQCYSPSRPAAWTSFS